MLHCCARFVQRVSAAGVLKFLHCQVTLVAIVDTKFFLLHRAGRDGDNKAFISPLSTMNDKICRVSLIVKASTLCSVPDGNGYHTSCHII